MKIMSQANIVIHYDYLCLSSVFMVSWIIIFRLLLLPALFAKSIFRDFSTTWVCGGNDCVFDDYCVGAKLSGRNGVVCSKKWPFKV